MTDFIYKNNLLYNVESFRPIISNVYIIDNSNKKWKQVSSNGWIRLEDNFFWPANPNNKNNWLNLLPPSVEDVKKTRLTKNF